VKSICFGRLTGRKKKARVRNEKIKAGKRYPASLEKALRKKGER